MPWGPAVSRHTASTRSSSPRGYSTRSLTHRHSHPRSSHKPFTILPTACPPTLSYSTPAQRLISFPAYFTSVAYHSWSLT